MIEKIFSTSHFSIQPKEKSIEEKKKELKKACEDFEAVFINELFREMKKASFGEGLIQKTSEHKMWENMFYENISKEMAEGGGLGLAPIIYKQLERGIR